MFLQGGSRGGKFPGVNFQRKSYTGGIFQILHTKLFLFVLQSLFRLILTCGDIPEELVVGYFQRDGRFPVGVIFSIREFSVGATFLWRGTSGITSMGGGFLAWFKNDQKYKFFQKKNFYKKLIFFRNAREFLWRNHPQFIFRGEYSVRLDYFGEIFRGVGGILRRNNFL